MGLPCLINVSLSQASGADREHLQEVSHVAVILLSPLPLVWRLSLPTVGKLGALELRKVL